MCRVLLLYALWLVCLRLNGQWLVLQLPTTEDLRSVAFCNADTGFVISALSIYRTTDGGSSWGVVASAPPPHRLYDIAVPKFSERKQTIYAVGGYMWFDFGNQTQDVGNVILKSTDFGATWQTTIGATGIGPSELNYVYALTDSIAFVMGSQGPFIPNNNFKKTTNGGLSWFATQNGISSTPYGGENIDFLDLQLGYRTFSNSAVIKTTNQGESWSILAVFPLVKNDFTDSTTGYVISDGVKKTTNGGTIWVQTNDTAMFPPNLTDMTFPERDIGFLSGLNGSLFKTTNGFDWVSLQSPANQSFFRLNFLNRLLGYIVGSGGVVLKTTNGGMSSVRESDTEKPIGFRLWQNYPNPFNPSTTIRYDLPTASIVKLQVFDLLGRSVALLVDERKDAGTYEVRFNASALASGVYFYRLEVTAISGVATGGFVETKKMVLLK